MVKELKDFSSRISTLTNSLHYVHVELINVHAPTDDKDDEK